MVIREAGLIARDSDLVELGGIELCPVPHEHITSAETCGTSGSKRWHPHVPDGAICGQNVGRLLSAADILVVRSPVIARLAKVMRII